MIATMPNAIVYARVSTTKQELRGLSIPGQIERCTLAAHQAGYEVTRVFQEAESASEDAEKRTAFQDAVAFTLDRTNGIRAFVVYDTSRFARRREDAIVYKGLLRKKGIKILYATQNIDGGNEDDLFIEGIFELMDERYSRVLSKLVLRGMVDNAKKGFFNGGRAPFGYVWEKVPVGETTKLKLVPDPAAAHIVRRAYSLVLEGKGCIEIARTFNEEGIFTKFGKRRWSNTVIHKILTSPKYTGDNEFSAGGETILVRNTHPSLVDRKTWDAVQETLKARSPARGTQRIDPRKVVRFSGLLYCGECGSAMVPTTGTSRTGAVHHYYECSNARKVGECSGHRMRAFDFDDMMMSLVQEHLFTRETLDRAANALLEFGRTLEVQTGEKRRQLKEQISALQVKLTHLYESIESGIDPQDIAPRIAQLSRTKRDLEAEELTLVETVLPEITEKDREEAAEFIQGLVRESEPEALCRFLKRLDFQIRIKPDKSVTITANPAYLVSETVSRFAARKIWQSLGDSNPCYRAENPAS